MPKKTISLHCETHEQSSIEYFCKTDKQAICSHCVIVGDHKDHDVQTMEDKVTRCVCLCVRVCVSARARACLLVYMHVYVVCTWQCVFIFIFVYMSVHVHASAFVHVYLDVCSLTSDVCICPLHLDFICYWKSAYILSV